MLSPTDVLEQLSFTYDDFGSMTRSNRETQLSPPGGGTAISNRRFTVDSDRNQIESVQLTTNQGPTVSGMSYDTNGNLRETGDALFLYDARNRLLQVQMPSPDESVVAQYSYDSNGFRVSKYEAHGQSATYYLRDTDGRVLSEFRRRGPSAKPVWSRDYVYALGRHVAMIENENPAAPRGIVPNASDPGDSPGSVDLTWELNTEPDMMNYHVLRTGGESYEFDVFNNTVHDANLTVGFTYTYRIQAVDVGGNLSEYSEPVVVTPGDATPPGKPYLPWPTVGDRVVHLKWIKPGDADVWGYRLSRRDDLSNPLDWEEIGGFIRSLAITDLTVVNGTTYQYKVQAVDTAGNVSPVTDADARTATPNDSAPPEAPSGLFAIPGSQSIELSWRPVIAADAVQYKVIRSATPITDPSCGGVACALSPATPTSHPPTSLIDTGLLPNTAYRYRVLAIDDDGHESALSEEIVVSTRDATVPAPSFHDPMTWKYCIDYDLGHAYSEFQCLLTRNICQYEFACFNHENYRWARLLWTGNPELTPVVAVRLYGRASDEEPYRLVREFDRLGVEDATRVNFEDYVRVEYPTAVHVNMPQFTGQPNRPLFELQDNGFLPEDSCGPMVFRASALVDIGGGVIRESVFSAPMELDGVLAEPEDLQVSPELDPNLSIGRFDGMRYGHTLEWNAGGGLCAGSPSQYHVYRKRAGAGPPIRLTREPIPATSYRVEYPPIPKAGTPPFELPIFAGPSGDSEGSSEAPTYAVSAVAADGTESSLSNLVSAHTDAVQGTGFCIFPCQNCQCPPTAPPVNYESTSLQVGIGEEVVTPTAPQSPTWEWRYVAEGQTSIGPMERNWALVKWNLPQQGKANEFVLLRRRSGETGYSEVPLSRMIPGDDGGIREFIWEMPLELACADANYAVQGIDLSEVAGEIGYILPTVPRQKLAPENVQYIAGPEEPYRVTWEALPTCPTGPGTHQVQHYSLMISDPATSCGGSAPDPTDFEEYSVAPQGGSSELLFQPPDQEHAYWFAMRVQWTDGASALSARVCVPPGGMSWVLPEPAATSEDSHWKIAAWAQPSSHQPDQSIAEPSFVQSAPRSIGQTGGGNPAVVLRFYHLDHLGTPRVITDVNGFPVSKHKYLPFGEELGPPPSTNTHKFTGHERDKETGLDYMKARYYGSLLGRFMSPDPLPGRIHFPQTLNRYIYAANNPIIFIDPDGRDFYLKCDSDDTNTCQDGHAGKKNDKGEFVPTIISSEKDSDGKDTLVDQDGTKYTAEVDSEGVHFTKEGTTETSTGVWKKGSADVSFEQKDGYLTGFSFEFTTDPHYGQDALGTFSFKGSRDKAEKALGAAGLIEQEGGFSRPGADFRSGADNQYNATHFNFDSRKGGNFHTGEPNLGAPGHGKQAAINLAETILFLHLGGDK